MDGLRRAVALILYVNTFAELTGYVFYVSIAFFFLLVERETLIMMQNFGNGVGWLFHEIVKLVYVPEFFRIFKCAFLINALSMLSFCYVCRCKSIKK